MARAPVVDGEETKDYPPSRTRKRGVAPPLVVKGEAENEAEARGREGRPAPGRTTEADFTAFPNETVFDNLLRRSGLPDADLGMSYIRIHLPRPVPKDGGVRLLIEKT